MALHDGECILRGKDSLIRQNRDRTVGGYKGKPVQIGSLHRLFYQFDAKILPLHLLEDPDRLLRRPCLICINPDLNVWPGCRPHSQKP